MSRVPAGSAEVEGDAAVREPELEPSQLPLHARVGHSTALRRAGIQLLGIGTFYVAIPEGVTQPCNFDSMGCRGNRGPCGFAYYTYVFLGTAGICFLSRRWVAKEGRRQCMARVEHSVAIGIEADAGCADRVDH